MVSLKKIRVTSKTIPAALIYCTHAEPIGETRIPTKKGPRGKTTWPHATEINRTWHVYIRNGDVRRWEEAEVPRCLSQVPPIEVSQSNLEHVASDVRQHQKQVVDLTGTSGRWSTPRLAARCFTIHPATYRWCLGMGKTWKNEAKHGPTLISQFLNSCGYHNVSGRFHIILAHLDLPKFEGMQANTCISGLGSTKKAGRLAGMVEGLRESTHVSLVKGFVANPRPRGWSTKWRIRWFNSWISAFNWYLLDFGHPSH